MRIFIQHKWRFLLGSVALLASNTQAQETGKLPAPIPTPPYTPLPQKPTDPATANASFESMVNSAYNLSTDQIRTVRKVDEAVTNAAISNDLRKPVISRIPVNLDPGSTPPAIRVSSPQTSIVQFLDQEGNPWPIIGISYVKDGSFEILDPSSNDNRKISGELNTLAISPIKPGVVGNFSVMLKNQPVAILITLLSGQKEVDYRTDLLIPGTSPTAIPPIIDLVTTKNRDTLLDFNMGKIPANAKTLKVNDSETKAWEYQGLLWIKTNEVVISPAWINRISSAQGQHFYALPLTPIIMVVRAGKTEYLTVKL